MVSLLRDAGARTTTIEPIGDGRVSWSYLADGEWIVKIPKFDAAVEPMRIQAELMPVVQEAVSFRVPVPEPIAEYGGRPVMRYRHVPGRALQPGDHWQDVAGMLQELHRIPVDRAAATLGSAGTAEAWQVGYADFREALQYTLYPRLDAALQERISAEYEHFLARTPEFTPTLVHCDRGAEHILVEPASGRPFGIIDFDWAAVGDPSIDFVGLLTTLGPEPVEEILRTCGDEVSWQRLLFYWWLNPCYELVYAAPYLDDDTVRRGIETVRARLAELPELRNRRQ